MQPITVEKLLKKFDPDFSVEKTLEDFKGAKGKLTSKKILESFRYDEKHSLQSFDDVKQVYLYLGGLFSLAVEPSATLAAVFKAVGSMSMYLFAFVIEILQPILITRKLTSNQVCEILI